jgi:dipeptidyl aminopeptidase/acylaminoacyl peptidase
MGRRAAPCGSWASPLDAARTVAAALSLSDCSLDGGDALWQELRPAEQGRGVVVAAGADGVARDLTAPPFDARTRVHEYGGRAYLRAGGVLYFSHGADQRLYRSEGRAAPRAITPAAEPAAALRYADLCAAPDGRRLWAVREDHRAGGEPKNELVVLDPQGDADGGRVVAAGADFVAAPRCSPDGRRLAWLQWNHPDMPWDGCELWLAEVRDDGTLHGARRIAGSRDEAVQQPRWSPDGTLHFVSDRSGWWNLYRWQDEAARPLCPTAAEFGEPPWVFGLATYGFAAPGEIVCVVVRDGRSTLARLHAGSGRLEPIALPFSSFGSLAVAGDVALFTAASPLQPSAVHRLELASGRLRTLRRSSGLDVDPAWTSVAEAIRYPGSGGRDTHAFFYAPANPDFGPLPGEKPPLIVMSHGGPTSRALDAYKPAIQFWTSRGFAVLDVNYGGSAGFGRAYRQRLDGQWGVVDVDDCALGARFLVQRGDVDPKRLIIRGGSAGGFTTLAALAFRDTFTCGASLYGIGDLQTLAEDTHKFESRYLDRLVGPWPAARERYRARSPIHHLDGLRCPLILLQGADDKVVPPAQSRRMHAALKSRGVPVAYLEFAGEPHGFRQAANIARALQAEAAFYARIFGFELADPVEPLVIDNL